MTEVQIELVDDVRTCRAIERLQQEVWGMPPRGIVPSEQLVTAAHNGGIVLLARVDGEPVGFCYGFVGLEASQPILCSHMLGVLPALRSLRIGERLKLAQRELARRRGMAKIIWTFDPLEARNAHLNLRKLRATARRYFVDRYGPMEDELNRGLPTDRLLAEWPTNPRGTTTGEPPGESPWLLTASGDPSLPEPQEPALDRLTERSLLIAVPANIAIVKRADRELALTWRMALREAFQPAFEADLVALDFIRDAALGVGAYRLERATA